MSVCMMTRMTNRTYIVSLFLQPFIILLYLVNLGERVKLLLRVFLKYYEAVYKKQIKRKCTVIS